MYVVFRSAPFHKCYMRLGAEWVGRTREWARDIIAPGGIQRNYATRRSAMKAHTDKSLLSKSFVSEMEQAYFTEFVEGCT